MIFYVDNPNDVVLANYQSAVDNAQITTATVKATLLESTAGGTITGATNATPIVITSAAHGLSNGDWVYVSKVRGNHAANGLFQVAGVTTNTFQLATSIGDGDYVAGGSWYRPITDARNITLSYNSTRKEYRGTFPENIPIVAGTSYLLMIDTDSGDHWEIGCNGSTRQQ